MGNPVRPLESTPAGPGPVPISPERELPGAGPEREVALPSREAEKLNQAAERVGEAVGKSVGSVRELPRRLAELKERLIVIRGRATEDASLAAMEWKQNARQRVRLARNRAELLADDYPVQVIVGAAALSFLVGFGLRIWRSNHALD